MVIGTINGNGHGTIILMVTVNGTIIVMVNGMIILMVNGGWISQSKKI